MTSILASTLVDRVDAAYETMKKSGIEAAMKLESGFDLPVTDQVQLLREIGGRFERVGNFAALFEARRRAVKLHPLDKQLTAELLLATMRHGTRDELNEAVERSALSPANIVSVFRKIGGEFLASNEIALAIASAEEAVRRAPSDSEVLCELLKVQITTGDIEAAARALQRTKVVDRLSALRDVAGEFRRSGDDTSTKAICELATAIAPDSGVIYSDLIKDEIFAGNFDRAIQLVGGSGLTAKAKSAVFGDLGSELFTQGRNDLAMRCRRIARDFMPADNAAQRELIQAALKFEGREAALAEAGKADFTVDGVYRHDFTALEKLIYAQVCDIAIASPELVVALVRAAQYVLRAKIPGAFVECGAFRGGSSMAVMLALLDQNVKDREFYLYDTFTGFPLPDEIDVYFDGRSAIEEWNEKKLGEGVSGWLVSTLEQTRANTLSTGYPEEHITFVKGLVEDTIPEVAPQQIAFLRLDTDFYVSTKHELDQLYHRLAPGGVLIIDDYGAFKGAQQAVDEFFADFKHFPFLHRIDSNVRMVIKDWAEVSAADGGAGNP